MPAPRTRGLLIVNADDLGLTERDTDATLRCLDDGSVTSATAMVWMRDSERAAALARAAAAPVGLHLNLVEPYTSGGVPTPVAERQRRIAARLRDATAAGHLYHPGWRTDVELCVADQMRRFVELYGRPPTHFDGHRHMHLVANALLARPLRGAGLRRCRRPVNRTAAESRPGRRAARSLLAGAMRAGGYRTTRRCVSIRALAPELGGAGIEAGLSAADGGSLEVMVHPGWHDELAVLRSPAWRRAVASHRVGSFADLASV
ncbi:MAG: ChbG/HpnK family deacetylase [Solirubrobacteraceae bacterium]